MKICLLENFNTIYTGRDRNDPKLRGAELALINYAEELAAKNFDVTFLNNFNENFQFKNVKYNNINLETSNFDIAIANGDANLFKYVKSKKNFLLSHSIQNFEKFFRKKQLIPFIKYKPKVICFSNYHYNSRSFLTSFYGKEIIIPSIDNEFYKAELPLKTNNDVIFYSRGDRNGQLILKIWKDLFLNNSIKSKFYIPKDLFIENEEMTKFNIKKKDYLPKNELIDFLKNFRLLIIPGHKGEVFCNVAEEAKALGIPIITMGMGALKERVKSNYNGFLCPNLEDFKIKILQLLKDDDLYLKFRNNLIKDRGENKWNNTINSLINLF